MTATCCPAAGESIALHSTVVVLGPVSVPLGHTGCARAGPTAVPGSEEESGGIQTLVQQQQEGEEGGSEQKQVG